MLEMRLDLRHRVLSSVELDVTNSISIDVYMKD